MQTITNTEAKAVYARESVTDVWAEMLDLLYQHYKEISHYQDIKLEPDLKAYLEIEEKGALRIYTVREGGSIIGYGVYFVRTNLHYQSSLQAHQDVLYIRKDKRGFGRNFIKWCDEQLKADGVQVIYHHIKTAHDWSPLLAEMGYDFVEKIYCKRLDL